MSAAVAPAVAPVPPSAPPSLAPSPRRPLIVVGSFPPPGVAITGGVHASCQALVDAGIAERFDFRPVDSSQPMTPPPSLASRILGAARRTVRFERELRRAPRPASALIFLSEGLSFVEKTVMAVRAKRAGLLVAVAPRGGAVREQLRRHAPMRVAARAMFGSADHVICQGASWIETFRPYAAADADAAHPRFVSLMNWTASDEMLALGRARAARAPEASGDARDPCVRVLYSGTLLERKGIFEMVEAFALAVPEAPALRLELAGDGTDEDALRARVERLGVADRTAFLGWVSGPEKLAAFARADALCLASHSEGLPNAVVEAMAAGLPCIVTPVGGVPDAAPDGECALHVPVRDPRALADALVRIAREPATRAALGARAHAVAAERFTADGALDTLARLLRA